MKKDEFEARVLDLWMTSAIPLTYASVQYHTRAPRRKVRRWLDDMALEGALDMDSSDEGELVFSVPGAARPASGPRTFAELERLQALRDSVATGPAGKRRVDRQAHARKRRGDTPARRQTSDDGLESSLEALDDALEARALMRTYKRRGAAGVARSMARSARQDLARGVGQGHKSLVLSGGLSLVFGPIGWLYAGSFREAIPAAFAYLLLMSVVPTFLLLPILGVGLPISAVAGMVYAWQHNHDGKRSPILGRDDQA